ncbi:hypothetical protein CSC74_05910 [Pseudoxanthomonas yeongjuensis]|nr:hypothetical protein CSC74_05910 [Pseudoxanthomonas yeongjuensis]
MGAIGMTRRLRGATAALFLLAASVPAIAAERSASRREFHIPPQPLDEALLAFSQQAGVELAAVGDFGKAGRSAAVSGIMTPASALRRLLGGSPFEFAIQPDGMVVVSPAGARIEPVPRAPVRVDESPAVATTNLATLVVTARKRDERLIDVPLALSAVSGERMETLGMENAAEVARLTPGVASVDAGGGFTQLQIRGVSSSIGGNDNGYYLDDVAFTGLTVPWHPDTRAFDLDRIEILKGPQGTLFGEGSLGGTIRILTHAPELDRFAAKAELGYASTQGGEAGSSSKAMANVPLVRDRLALRVVATQETLPGWIDDPASGRRDVNRQDDATRRARLRWSPGDHWLTDFNHAGSISDAPGGGYAAADDGQAPALLGTRSQWRSDSFVSSYLTSTSRFTYLYSDSSLDYTLDGKLTPSADGSGSIRVDVSAHEFRWSYSIDDRLDWVAGYSHRRATRADRLVVAGSASAAAQSNRADTIYGEGTVRTRDGAWSLTAGLRYFIDNVNALATEGVRNSAIDSTFESVNPRLVVARQLSSDHLWYATASSGFRSGQLQPVTSLVAAQAAGIELPLSIAPDEIRSYEIGFKRLLAHKRVLVQGAVFQSRWKGLPVRIPIDELNNGIANSKGALIRGVEAGIRYAAPSNLSLELGASAVDAAYVADVPDTPLVKGSKVYNVPKFTASASASYAWPVCGDLTAVASASGLYNSRRSTSLTVGSSGDPILSASARIGIESPRGWAWYAYGDNLGGEDGAVDGRTSFGTATRLRPRTFGVEFRYSY